MFLSLWMRQASSPPAAPAALSGAAEPGGRLVVLILDSLPRAAAEHAALMPEVTTLSQGPSARWLPVRTCAGNFTLPCMQTLFEGRESPFSSSLHNYTGASGDDASLPGIAVAHGLTSTIVSDQSLTSLYGHFARVSVDSSGWDPDPLLRDRDSIAAGVKALREGRDRLLLLHVVGTDKISHHYDFGKPEYIQHYQAVSRALAPLFAELDFEKDSLLITGDHGHGDGGHHTRESTVLLVGKTLHALLARLPALPSEVEQQDLLYFMTYALLLPLPPTYEGAFFPVGDGAAPDRIRRFERLQDRTLAAQGLEGPTLADKAAQLHARQAARAGNDFWQNLPVLLCYLSLALRLLLVLDLRRQLVLIAGHGLLALLVGVLATPERGPWLAILPLIPLLAPLFRADHRREAAFWLCLLCTALPLSYAARDHMAFFHIRDGFSLVYPLFMIGVLLAGLPLAYLRWGCFRRAGIDLVAVGSLAFCFFSLPRGVYYYQGGANLLQSFVRAALVLGLLSLLVKLGKGLRSPKTLFSSARALVRPGTRIGTLLLVLSAPFLLLQDAGGWEWRSYLQEYLHHLGTVPTLILHGLLGLLLAASLPGWGARLVVLALVGVTQLYCTQVGDLHPSFLVAAHAPAAVIAGWFLHQRRASEGAGSPGLSLEGPGHLVVMAGLSTVIWFVIGGFSIARFDFSFTYDLLAWVRTDAAFFAMALPLSILKYGLPVAVILVFLVLHLESEEIEKLFSGILSLLQLKLAFLFAQFLFGSLRSGEKLHELAIGEVATLSLLLVLVAVIYALLVGVSHLASRRET